jgi:hypothetical protein
VLKLLSLWLAWRTVRLITAVVVIVGALALLAHSRQGGAHRGNTALTQLRRVVSPLEQQLERTIEKALKQ